MYRERQISWVLLISIAAVLIFLGVMGQRLKDVEPEASLIMYVTAMIITIAALLFYQLDTIIDQNTVRLKFGIGLIKKQIPLENIKSVQKVRNKWWYGWGLRLTPVGWLWNIKGLDAVELDIEGNRRAFRIGTQYPDKLEAAIKERL